MNTKGVLVALANVTFKSKTILSFLIFFYFFLYLGPTTMDGSDCSITRDLDSLMAKKKWRDQEVEEMEGKGIQGTVSNTLQEKEVIVD